MFIEILRSLYNTPCHIATKIGKMRFAYCAYRYYFFISSNHRYSLIESYSTFKAKTHNAYIIIMINKESYKKEKES